MIRIMVMVVVVMVAMISIKRFGRSLHFALSFLHSLTLCHRPPPEAMAIQATIPAIKTSQAIS